MQVDVAESVSTKVALGALDNYFSGVCIDVEKCSKFEEVGLETAGEDGIHCAALDVILSECLVFSDGQHARKTSDNKNYS